MKPAICSSPPLELPTLPVYTEPPRDLTYVLLGESTVTNSIPLGNTLIGSYSIAFAAKARGPSNHGPFHVVFPHPDLIDKCDSNALKIPSAPGEVAIYEPERAEKGRRRTMVPCALLISQ